MPVSGRVKSLYTEQYEGGSERAWRDVGAIDKSGDIERAWTEAGLPARPRVVEIGCGEGAVAAALANRSFFDRYEGFELSASGVMEATARSVPGAEFRLVEGDSIPVEDDGADLAVLSHVVEHLEHPRQMIYEAARIAPYVFVEVPLELNSRLPRDYVWDDLGHINKYTSTSIRQLVQTCGLDVVVQFTMNPSKSVATFNDSSSKRNAEWLVKEKLLLVQPRLARSVFTYHEALLARRPSA